MAYRKLKAGDLVRIVDVTNGLHGCDVVVIDAQEHYSRVQFYGDGTRCYDIPNRNLLVRHSEYYFINDGRIDHKAKRIHDEQLQHKYVERNDVDEDTECEYADWTHEDLVERIKDLERIIEQHEEPF